MGFLGNALGALGKVGGGIGKMAAGAGGGGGGEGIAGALQKGMEIFGGVKGLIDQAKGLGGDQQAAAAEQAGGAQQQEGAQKAEGKGEEHPLLRLAKMVLEAIEDPKKLEELKQKVPKEFAGAIDQIVQAAGQMKQAA